VKIDLIDDYGIWVAALLMATRYDDDAVLEAVKRGKRLLEEHNLEGAVNWHRILRAIERLQAKAPVRARRFTESVGTFAAAVCCSGINSTGSAGGDYGCS